MFEIITYSIATCLYELNIDKIVLKD